MLLVISSHLLACQPEGADENNSPEVPYYHSQKALYDTIVTAIRQDKIANIDGLPGEEVSTDEIIGVINKRGDCLFVDDYLV